MTKPAHVRCTWEGHIGNSATSVVERWSFSLNSAPSAEITGADAAALNAKATSLRNAYTANLNGIMPANCWLTRVKIADIAADGTYSERGDGSYRIGIHESPHDGGMAASGMPLQVALCVGLVTARSGPTGKGRFFLPWPSLSLSTDDKRVPEAQLTPVVANVAAFLGAVNDVLGLNVGVVSSKGYITDVTGVRIGRRPDTLRSRNEDVSEGYLSASVPQ